MEICHNPFCPIEECYESYRGSGCSAKRAKAGLDFDPDLYFEMSGENESPKKYIDSSRLLTSMWKNLYRLEDLDEQKHGPDPLKKSYFNLGFEAARKAVLSAPAADVQEMKHSQIYLDGTCSSCGKYIDIQPHKRYCCFCGAKIGE